MLTLCVCVCVCECSEYRGKVYFTQTFVIQELVTQKEFVDRYNVAAEAEEPAAEAEPMEIPELEELAGAAKARAEEAETGTEPADNE